MKFDPDKGSGRPGSLRWHTLHIEQCESFEELYDYFQSVNNSKIKIPLKLAKKLAKHQIEEYINGKGK